jgi:hypothetical protein
MLSIRVILIIFLKVLLLHSLLSFIEFLEILHPLVIIETFIDSWCISGALLRLNDRTTLLELGAASLR